MRCRAHHGGCHRYGGIFAIGMAYRGTANNAAIQKLLHFAVSDVSNDVRRAAVLNLGFLLMGVPEQCPRIVSLLSESYNPHVRYGGASPAPLETMKNTCSCVKRLVESRVSATKHWKHAKLEGAPSDGTARNRTSPVNVAGIRDHCTAMFYIRFPTKSMTVLIINLRHPYFDVSPFNYHTLFLVL